MRNQLNCTTCVDRQQTYDGINKERKRDARTESVTRILLRFRERTCLFFWSQLAELLGVTADVPRPQMVLEATETTLAAMARAALIVTCPRRGGSRGVRV
uniref:Uncharacterized protein n=1 Tax=Kalanchoe fedtschenkoi TaxID=63787 RepID=A0A7N0UBJ8_KALFE